MKINVMKIAHDRAAMAKAAEEIAAQLVQNVPDEMKAAANWVNFELVPNPKAHSGFDKVPINPKNGNKAQSNNPDTWGTFGQACDRLKAQPGAVHGVGLMLGHSRFAGFDDDEIYAKLLDDQIKEDVNAGRLPKNTDLKEIHKKVKADGVYNGLTIAEMSAKALESGNFYGADLVKEFNSYTEVSPSGNGLHVYFVGKLPPSGRKKEYFEMYEDGRFLTVTGEPYKGFKAMNAPTAEVIAKYHEKYITKGIYDKKKTSTAPPPPKPTMSSRPAVLDDNQIITRAMRNPKFAALWAGNISGYPSQSEADLALCELLAFWTGGDAEQMDRLFRQSRLYRENKWDRSQSGTTYGATTINKAIDLCPQYYDPNYYSNSSGFNVNIKSPGSTPISIDGTTAPADFVAYNWDGTAEAPAGAAADQSAAPYDQTLQAIPQPLKEKAHGNGINSADDFEGRCLTPYVFEKFCQLMGYNFKWDVLKHKPVFYGFKKTELKDTLANTAPTILKPALFGLGVKKVTSENISDCILVHATRRAFNPVLEIINGTQWDGVDRLNEIYSMWNITDDFDRVLIHKWLIQCYCMLHNELDGAFGAEYTLVFKGAQGAGKTQFFKHLALHDEFFKEGATLDPNDKDSRLEALSTWICELGELGSTMKKDIDMLKAEMTRAIDIIRPPYARTANEYPRRTSFCATVNDEKFLLDTTGNRRWGIIRLDDDLKVPYSTVKKLNSLQLWAQIAVEVENKITATKPEPDPTTYENAFRLTPEELDRLLKRSGCFVKPVKAQDEVADIIELMKERVYNDYVVDYKPQSATEFKEEVRSLGYEALRKYSSSQIANALEVLGYVNKVYKVNGKSKRGYLLPYHRRK
jgi:hypothetical protein